MVFGKLPNVGQVTTGRFSGNTLVANDCYLIVEASITAGRYKGTDCTVSPTGADDYMAACIVTPNPGAVENNWVSGLALELHVRNYEKHCHAQPHAAVDARKPR